MKKKKMINQEKIDQIKSNLFHRSKDAVWDYHTFPWHKSKSGEIDSDKAKSSQALTIDVFGCLKNSPILNLLINRFFNFGEENTWEVIFEYTDRNALNELTASQIDVFLKGRLVNVFIECKFCETSGGPCSQTKRLKNRSFAQCSGNYELQKNPVNNVEAKCSLTGKGIKYWDFASEIFSLSPNEDYYPCPFKGEAYQFMRNIAFSRAISRLNNLPSYNFLFYFDSTICPFKRKVEKKKQFGILSKIILDRGLIKTFSYQEFIKSCIEISEFEKNMNEKKVWVDLNDWLSKKEAEITNA